jgi:hypothetical protein
MGADLKVRESYRMIRGSGLGALNHGRTDAFNRHNRITGISEIIR